jgi:aarF domain-containing kinase
MREAYILTYSPGEGQRIGSFTQRRNFSSFQREQRDGERRLKTAGPEHWRCTLGFSENGRDAGMFDRVKRFDLRTAPRTKKVVQKIAQLREEQRRTVESASRSELATEASTTEIDLSLLFENSEERSIEPFKALQALRTLSRQGRERTVPAPEQAGRALTGYNSLDLSQAGSLSAASIVDNEGRLHIQRNIPDSTNGMFDDQTVRKIRRKRLEWTPQPILRSLDIWDFTAQFLLTVQLLKWRWTYGFVRSKKELEEKRKERRQAIAAWTREELIRLGPTFIKAGQLFSARSDLFPPEVIEELSKLQDSVPPFSAETAKKIIQEELGLTTGGINDVFEFFDDEPIAAASLGQVHLARLRATGEYVVVKVQRRLLRELFDIDLRLLRSLAAFAQRSRQFGGPTRDWLGIFEECKNVLLREIDYMQEGRSADRFRENFRDIPWVRVPRVYWEYTTQRVLVQQYLPGVKISDVSRLQQMGFDLSRIAKRVAEAYLFQILGSGFFHADPHPGNLAVAPGDVLIYYDFGMMGELPGNIKDRIVQLLAAVVDKDAETVMKLMIELGALVPPRDPAPVRRTIQFFLNSLGSRPVRSQTVQAIGEDLYSIAYDRPFRLPATFTFVLRAFTTLEGLCRALNPNFSFGEIAQPYGLALLRRRSQVQSFRSWFSNRALRSVVSLPNRLEQLERSMQKIENGDVVVRSRSTEVERLLRRQNAAMEASLATTVAAALSIATIMVNGSVPVPGVGELRLSWVLGLLAFSFGTSAVRTYLGRVRREDRWDRFLRDEGEFANNNVQ